MATTIEKFSQEKFEELMKQARECNPNDIKPLKEVINYLRNTKGKEGLKGYQDFWYDQSMNDNSKKKKDSEWGGKLFNMSFAN